MEEGRKRKRKRAWPGLSVLGVHHGLEGIKYVNSDMVWMDGAR